MCRSQVTNVTAQRGSARKFRGSDQIPQQTVNTCMIAWLQSTTVWILLAVTPGGADSQLAIYTNEQACLAARETYQELDTVRQLGLRVECRQRVRTQYQGR